MAQASQFHRQQRWNDLNLHGQSFQQQQFGPSTLSEASLPSRFGYFQQAQIMALPLHRQYRPEGHLNGQQWQPQQSYPQEFRPAPDAHARYALNDTANTQNSFWDGSIFDHEYALHSNMCMPPYIMQDLACSSASNCNLIYPEATSQGFVGKAIGQYDAQPSWVESRPNGFPCGVSMNGSDPDTNSSLSPKSYTSDNIASETLPFTPDITTDGASSASSWARYSTSSFPAIRTSSPKDSAQAIEDVAEIGGLQQQRIGLDVIIPSPTSAGANYRYHELPSPYNYTSKFDSEYSSTHKSTPGASPLCSPGMSYTQAVMPSGPRESQTSSNPFNSLPNPYQAHRNISRPHEGVAWSVSHASVSARDRFQDHLHIARPMDAQAQRKADDEILLGGKMNGLTYKEIRKKMSVKCAESTLRGRYRSLTKARKDRVRKPTWKERDIDLMNEFVQQELDRIDGHQHMSLSYDQRLAKVPWKKVADLIHVHGGSYRFGNSTCKRKYMELHPSP